MKDVEKTLNRLIFVIGIGNVGSKLLNQINQQSEYLKENLN